MNSIMKITLFASGAVLVYSLAGRGGIRPLAEFQAVAHAAPEEILTLDVAVDCRTFVGGPNRGDPVIVNGKVFPGGTFPSGPTTLDPTKPVNGVAPIGDWIQRGQNSFPFPPALAAAYGSTPVAFGTIYFILND